MGGGFAIRIAAVQETAGAAVGLFEVAELEYAPLVVVAAEDKDGNAETDENGSKGAQDGGLSLRG